MISWVTNLFKLRRKSPRDITNRYWYVGSQIGGVLATMGRERHVTVARGWCFDVDDPELYHWLDELEVLYAELGYRIISLQDWIDYAGWGVSLDHLWKVKRAEGERPCFTQHTTRPEIPRKHPLAEN